MVGVRQDRSGVDLLGTGTASMRGVSGRYSGGEVGVFESAQLACPEWALAAEVPGYAIFADCVVFAYA